MKYVVVLPLVVMGFLTACGGGGSGENNTIVAPAISCKATETLKNGVCITPVANVCTTEDEKRWVRSHLDDVYLWYNEIKDVPRQNYDTPQKYFDALLVKDKDRFSFTLSKKEAESFYESGLQLSYGVLWAYDETNRLRVRFVEPNSQAANLGIKRGDYVQAINNKMIPDLTAEQIDQALTPTANKILRLNLIAVDAKTLNTVTLMAGEIVTNPVPNYTILTSVKNSQDKVGYLLFNDHIATAPETLIAAVEYFNEQKISGLVLDLRFNSGGYAYVANELAAMIGGNKTKNKLFKQSVPNNKYPSEYEYFEQFSYPSSKKLPYLNLSRVIVLTTNQTCSASEAIINALSPFMNVVRIGTETCGKPYGMIGTNNCDTAYFVIRHQNQNAINQSIPTTGYTPHCLAYESLDDELGSPNESLLSNALYFHENNQCFISSSIQSKKVVNKSYIRPLLKPYWQRNMIGVEKK